MRLPDGSLCCIVGRARAVSWIISARLMKISSSATPAPVTLKLRHGSLVRHVYLTQESIHLLGLQTSTCHWTVNCSHVIRSPYLCNVMTKRGTKDYQGHGRGTRSQDDNQFARPWAVSWVNFSLTFCVVCTIVE